MKEGIHMKRFTLYLGLNDKDSKTQKIDTLEAYKIVENMLASMFNGGTIFNAHGVYKHDNGQVVIENTLRIEILEFDNSIIDNVREFVRILKDVFNQESIAVQIEVCNSELW